MVESLQTVELNHCNIWNRWLPRCFSAVLSYQWSLSHSPCKESYFFINYIKYLYTLLKCPNMIVYRDSISNLIVPFASWDMPCSQLSRNSALVDLLCITSICYLEIDIWPGSNNCFFLVARPVKEKLVMLHQAAACKSGLGVYYYFSLF